MSEADATLRVKQARKRIIEIKNLLADLQSLNISKRKQNDSKKKFISPQDLDVASSRWNSFLINAGRQHFGIKQKIIEVNRMVTNNQLNVSTMRLLSSVSLSILSLLKVFLQFPDDTRQALVSTKDSVPAKVIDCAEHLMILMAKIGVINHDERAMEESTSSISMVESEIVDVLEKQQRVNQHMESLAASLPPAIQSSERPCIPSIELPHGRQMQLLQDTLSQRLSQPSSRPETLGVVSEGAKRETERTCSINNAGRQARTSKSVDKKNKTLSRPARRWSFHDQKKHSSVHPSFRRAHSVRTRKCASEESCQSADWEEEWHPSSAEENEELWQQLMPLLTQQEQVVLAEDSEEEGEQMLLQVEQLLQRIELLEQECKREALTIDLPDAGEDGDEVEVAMKKAHDLLKSMGFMEASRARPFVSACDEATEDNESSSSAGLLKQLRDKREIFWAKLASSGCVET